MSRKVATLAPLQATPYLQSLRDLVRETEPELWSFFAGSATNSDLIAEARQALLRSAYRLDGAAHMELLEAAALAAERVGVTDPVTLYQAQDGSTESANAMVISLPGEAHVVFSGRLLELAEDVELVAVIGHELAHHVLWTMEGGDFWVLDRLVHASANDISARPCHEETARLLRLHTELVADRGGLLAANGDLDSAVAALVKISTGLASVSGASYLKQSKEVIGGKEPSAGVSHPEMFVRVWALSRWATQGDSADEEIAERVAGPVDVENLDVLSQRQVTDGVHALIHRFLSYPWARTDALVGHASLFGEGAVPPKASRSKTQPMPAPLEPCAEGLTDLYAYVLLDLATVDEEVESVATAAAFVLSDELGIAKRFDALVAKELAVSAKDVRSRRAKAADTLKAAAKS